MPLRYAYSRTVRRRGSFRRRPSYSRVAKTSRKRRSLSRRKPYAKRRKSSKKSRGPFQSMGNKYIAATKDVNLKWMDPITDQIGYPSGNIGQVYIGKAVDCPTCACNLPIEGLDNANFSENMFNNYDMYASKYQRAKLKMVDWKFEFSFPTTSGLASVGNQFIVGAYLSSEELKTQITGLCDFEELKKSGNLCYKKVQQFDTATVLNCPVNVQKCMENSSAVDGMHILKTKEKVSLLQSERQTLFPSGRPLRLYPFVVFQSDVLISNWIMRVRSSCTKTCHFSRPIQNIRDTLALDNYPPVVSDLPSTFVPEPLEFH